MESNGLERLVLLEDFIGTGNQAKDAIEFAASLDFIDHVLVVPMVICPQGLQVLNELQTANEKVSVSAVYAVPKRALLTEVPGDGEPADFASFRDLVNNSYVYLEESLDYNARFGYQDTGSLVIYSNCPNNTIGLIHHETGDWKALFRRADRK